MRKVSRRAVHEAGHALLAVHLYRACGPVSLDPSQDFAATTGPADGEACSVIEVLIGLAGAAACEVVGLRHPRRGAETDLWRVAQVVPDRAQREALYREVVELLREPGMRAAARPGG